MNAGASLWVLALAAALGASGCAPVDRDALAADVLAVDPEFEAVLEKHRELSNRIDTYQRELALKRGTVGRTIKQLREDLASSARTVRSRTVETKAKMEPDRRRLLETLDQAAKELKAKQGQRAAIGRSMSQLKKSLERSAATSSAGARERQAATLEQMAADAARVDREIAALRSHVRLLKVKLLLIKL
jgi:hypothetical protein